jgi:phospholipid-binding lipoprotein MlaA
MPPAYPPLSRSRAAILCGVLSLSLFGGCATNGNPRDPLEPLNRAVYAFNDGVDTVLFKPAARAYRFILPNFAQTGVSNFFSNLNDVIVLVNNLLQGKLQRAGSDFGRIAMNTSFGVLGFIDVATDLGLEKHNEDFGQTLGYWGFGDGPYLVLPFLGPSSVRDTVGWVGDFYAWPVSYIDNDRTRYTLIGVRFISLRAELLEASRILETAALDPYEFVRDAFLQRRRNLVWDGNPPPDEDDVDDPKPKPEAQKEPPKPEAPATASDQSPPAGGGVTTK